MAVGFKIDFLWYQIGHGNFLHSFFSTVCYRLEEGEWGKNYPYLMKKLYQGCLEWEDVTYAKKELEEISKKLEAFPPDSVVWDINDLKKQPPWGENRSSDITNLANYFITSDGKDFISVLFQVFHEAEIEKHKIEIVAL